MISHVSLMKPRYTHPGVHESLAKTNKAMSIRGAKGRVSLYSKFKLTETVLRMRAVHV